MTDPRQRSALAGLLPRKSALFLALLMAVGCTGGNTSPVGVFEVGPETYRIELNTPEMVDIARGYLEAGGVIIPNGIVVRDDASVNGPWSWHIDPNTVEWAEFTIEVCDGLPSHVEEGIITSDRYCPWSAVLIEIEDATG